MEILTDCCRLSGLASEWETPGAQPCERSGDPGRRGKVTMMKYTLRLLITWMFSPGERTLAQYRVKVNSAYSLEPSSFFLSHLSHVTCTCSVMSYSLRFYGLDRHRPSPPPHPSSPPPPQAPLSMGLSRQEYWSGLPFPTPGDLPKPGMEPASPALAGEFLPLSSYHYCHLGSPSRSLNYHKN